MCPESSNVQPHLDIQQFYCYERAREKVLSLHFLHALHRPLWCYLWPTCSLNYPPTHLSPQRSFSTCLNCFGRPLPTLQYPLGGEAPCSAQNPPAKEWLSSQFKSVAEPCPWNDLALPAYNYGIRGCAGKEKLMAAQIWANHTSLFLTFGASSCPQRAPAAAQAPFP